MKKSLVLILVSVISLSVMAQDLIKSVSIQYASVYSLTTEKNGIYVAGAINYPGSQKLTEGVIIKYDKNLNQIWQKTFGGPLSDHFNSIVYDNGQIYAVGISWRPNKENKLSQGWLLILDKDGQPIKERFFGDQYQDGFNKIIKVNDGFLIIGYYTPQASNTNLWLVKINSDGEVIWQKKYGTIVDKERGVSACVASNGYLILAEVLRQGTDNIDPWILSVDQRGNIQWDRSFKVYEDNYFFSCFPYNSNYILIGNTAKNISNKKSDLWIMQININGKTGFDKAIGTYKREWGYGAVIYRNQILIGGTSSLQDKAQIWYLNYSGDLIKTQTFNLPGIKDIGFSNNTIIICGGDKSNGYVAMVRP